jgi:hypothetical protein
MIPHKFYLILAEFEINFVSKWVDALVYHTGIIWQGPSRICEGAAPLEILAHLDVSDTCLGHHIWLGPKKIMNCEEVPQEDVPLYMYMPWKSNKFLDFIKK